MVFNHILEHRDSGPGNGGPLNFHTGDGRNAELAQGGIIEAHNFNVLRNPAAQALSALHGSKGHLIVAADDSVHRIFLEMAFYLQGKLLPGVAACDDILLWGRREAKALHFLSKAPVTQVVFRAEMSVRAKTVYINDVSAACTMQVSDAFFDTLI